MPYLFFLFSFNLLLEISINSSHLENFSFHILCFSSLDVPADFYAFLFLSVLFPLNR